MSTTAAGFNFWALFFGPYYYVGHGERKVAKIMILGLVVSIILGIFVSAVPFLTYLGICIYAGFNADKDIGRRGNFSMMAAIGLFVILFGLQVVAGFISAAVFIAKNADQIEQITEDFNQDMQQLAEDAEAVEADMQELADTLNDVGRAMEAAQQGDIEGQMKAMQELNKINMRNLQRLQQGQ